MSKSEKNMHLPASKLLASDFDGTLFLSPLPHTLHGAAGRDLVWFLHAFGIVGGQKVPLQRQRLRGKNSGEVRLIEGPELALCDRQLFGEMQRTSSSDRLTSDRDGDRWCRART